MFNKIFNFVLISLKLKFKINKIIQKKHFSYFLYLKNPLTAQLIV